MDASEQADDVSAALDVLDRKLDRIDAMPGGEAKTAAIRALAEEIQKLYNRAAASVRARCSASGTKRRSPLASSPAG